MHATECAVRTSTGRCRSMSELSRTEKIVAAMEAKKASLEARRVGLVDLFEYHQGVIDSGKATMGTFEQRWLANDDIERVDRELASINCWLEMGDA